MLVLLITTLVLSPPNSFSNGLSEESISSDLNFCSPVVGNEADVMEVQLPMTKISVLFGHLQCSILSQSSMINDLRAVMRSRPQSSSSFSPSLTIFRHSSTLNFLNFLRALLAFASDSHKYLISLHLIINKTSTPPRYSITPLHATSLSRNIDSIFNSLIDEAT
ncbi:hypothetical protein Hanom_Chr04g00292141 [Helianthus anomalus]